jgi:multidrug efflux pump
VLAIGIVVDDAIVVVENVERNIEAGLSPRDATLPAMHEVSGPIIAIALVLVAVFVPLAFMTGLTGQFYKQFALTIAISTVISAFNSLTCRRRWRRCCCGPRRAQGRAHARHGPWFGGFFAASSTASSSARQRRLRRAACPASSHARRSAMGVYAGCWLATVGLFKVVPGGFVPAQDKQYLIGFAQLPDGRHARPHRGVIRRMSEIALAQPGVETRWPSPACRSTASPTAATRASCSPRSSPSTSARSPDQSAGAIAGQLNQQFAPSRKPSSPCSRRRRCMGLGTPGGFKLQIEDRAPRLQANWTPRKGLHGRGLPGARTGPALFSSYQINVPQLYADIDRAKAKQLGVPVTDVFDTLQIYLGSLYVNDFNRFGRTYQVRVQADAEFRAAPRTSGAEDPQRQRRDGAAGRR